MMAQRIQGPDIDRTPVSPGLVRSTMTDADGRVHLTELYRVYPGGAIEHFVKDGTCVRTGLAAFDDDERDWEAVPGVEDPSEDDAKIILRAGGIPTSPVFRVNGAPDDSDDPDDSDECGPHGIEGVVEPISPEPRPMSHPDAGSEEAEIEHLYGKGSLLMKVTKEFMRGRVLPEEVQLEFPFSGKDIEDARRRIARAKYPRHEQEGRAARAPLKGVEMELGVTRELLPDAKRDLSPEEFAKVRARMIKHFRQDPLAWTEILFGAVTACLVVAGFCAVAMGIQEILTWR